MNRRQAEILEILRSGGEVSVTELAKRFEVTRMTVRRDLTRLERRGCLARTHGGAVPAPAGIIQFAFATRGEKNAAAKRAIALEVASRVQPGSVLCLDTGTTTLQVARAIAEMKDLSVVTPSLAVAAALYAFENINLVLLGGSVRKGSPDLSGAITEENLGKFNYNLAVLGADGANASGVFTTGDGTARVCQSMMSGAGAKILAMDSSKFGARALVRYARWDQFDEVITDTGAPEEARGWLSDAGVKLTCVDPATGKVSYTSAQRRRSAKTQAATAGGV